ncbi:MAG: AraC family transcriptional regulator [Saccharospirillaceae bacterium]|nr:helix-turn-helix domain-containing protein [Pseudomonadales bacterium]NRB77462.1 AraC family transcriptional regulator [Saccharospirillaceae bacterium]
MNNIKSINLEIIKPTDELSHYVHSVWFAKNTTNTQTLSFEILNDGCMGLLFNFSDDILLQLNNRKLILNTTPVLNGASSDLSKMSFQGGINALGIRFLPTANLYFFSEPIESLANSLILIDDKIFKSIESFSLQLTQAVKNGSSNLELFSIIESFLITKIQALVDKAIYAKNEILINSIVNTISNNSEIDIDSLCLKNNINKRQLQRLFKQYIGITAKSFMRLKRVQSVKDRLTNNTFTSLTDLSCESGYFDQSHFIRDFKVLMELTPKQYVKRKQQDSDIK